MNNYSSPFMGAPVLCKINNIINDPSLDCSSHKLIKPKIKSFRGKLLDKFVPILFESFLAFNTAEVVYVSFMSHVEFGCLFV